MATENPFVKLFAIDFKDHLEVKKSGNTELKYVSWAYAWAEVTHPLMGGCKLCRLHDGAILQLDPLDGLVAPGTDAGHRPPMRGCAQTAIKPPD